MIDHDVPENEVVLKLKIVEEIFSHMAEAG